MDNMTLIAMASIVFAGITTGFGTMGGQSQPLSRR
jgi:hypothetical protein